MAKNYLQKLPDELKRITRVCAEVSRETAMPAYLVGGFVRDLILGVKNFDLDITVEGNGIIFARKLAQKLKSDLRIHERFGTANLNLGNALKVDIATTRKEKYPVSACLPVVSLGSIAEDLLRRDFTVNAMALEILGEEKLIDPFGGSDDLKNGKIRVLHDCSFKDDPTRILRAVRFEQRFGFKIESKTLNLLKQAIAQGYLKKVHLHRMRESLILMFKEKNPRSQMKRLSGLKGLVFLSEKLKFGKTTHSFYRRIENEINWFVKKFSARRELDVWLIYFTALLTSLRLPQVKSILKKLGLRKGEEKRVIGYCGHGKKLVASLSRPGVSPSDVFSLLGLLSYEEIILLKASSKDKNLKKYIIDFLEIYNDIRILVSGHDLAGLGIPPGPRYKNLFSEVLKAKLNGQVKSHQDEMSLIGKLIEKKRS